jgi:hypothetical protein
MCLIDVTSIAPSGVERKRQFGAQSCLIADAVSYNADCFLNWWAKASPINNTFRITSFSSAAKAFVRAKEAAFLRLSSIFSS